MRFHAGRAPSREEIADVAGRVAKRMTKWLRRRKLLDERPAEERSNEAPEVSALEACMQLSLFGGTFWAAEVDGFNIHAGVLIHAGDREGLERLCRYGARPPFSLERISLLTDGRVGYLLKKPRSNGATHLVMTPVQLLARISTLIPPPRFPRSASRASLPRTVRGVPPSSRCARPRPPRPAPRSRRLRLRA